MTRRITLAILVTVWAMLVASGTTAYYTTRSVLLSDLDATLTARACSLPGLLPPAWPLGAGEDASADRGDRFVIRYADDQRQLRPPPSSGTAFSEPELLHASFSRLADGRRMRTVTVRTLARPAQPGSEPAEVTVTYSGSAERFHRLLGRLWITLLVTGAVGGLLAAGVAWRTSVLSLRPLRRTAETVAGIDERRLDRRVETAELPPELTPVVEKLNELLGRLQLAFAARGRFLADAAHELRTPVAALVTGLEVTLSRRRDADDYRRCLQDALEDTVHLRSLVERLMEQVRSEQFTHDEPAQDVDVSRLIDECADVAEALGRDRQIRVERDYPPGLRFVTQPSRLRSILTNVLSNAVEYNRPEGFVRITADSGPIGLSLRVSDSGMGIKPEHLPHVFEPFFRGDKARSRAAGHLGLGLFLVESHLQATGGRCNVSSSPNGTTFCFHWPDRSGAPRSVGLAVSSASHGASSTIPTGVST